MTLTITFISEGFVEVVPTGFVIFSSAFIRDAAAALTRVTQYFRIISDTSLVLSAFVSYRLGVTRIGGVHTSESSFCLRIILTHLPVSTDPKSSTTFRWRTVFAYNFQIRLDLEKTLNYLCTECYFAVVFDDIAEGTS